MKLIFLPFFLATSLLTGLPLGAFEAVHSPPSPSIDRGEESETSIEIRIKGSMCPACLKRLESTLSAVRGVRSVRLASDNLAQKSKIDRILQRKVRHYALFAVSFDLSQTSTEEIEKAIRQRDFVISSVRVLGR